MEQFPCTGLVLNVNLEQARVQADRVLIQPGVYFNRFEAALGLDREADFLARLHGKNFAVLDDNRSVDHDVWIALPS